VPLLAIGAPRKTSANSAHQHTQIIDFNASFQIEYAYLEFASMHLQQNKSALLRSQQQGV
jgi:hypothetical protein